MLAPGPAIKVIVHLNEDSAAAHGFLHEEILALLRDHGVDGATLLRADAGFGSHHRMHTAGAGDVAGLHLPLILYFIETREKVEELLPSLLEMVTDGLVEAHPTEILKNASSSSKVVS